MSFAMNKKITVIGSTNVDMCSRVDHLPLPGETVGKGCFMQAYGGKGANQAMAARRLGGDVTFITTLGKDSLGRELLENFSREGIDTSAITCIEGVSTGIALILIDKEGENCIAVNPGANAALTPKHLEPLTSVIENSRVIVMQAEIPYETVRMAASIAQRNGVGVLYNPAPILNVDDEMLGMTDVLVVNQNEGATLSGKTDVEEIARQLHGRGASTVVVTLGSKGAYCYDGTEGMFAEAYKVKAVDTVGAGDTFCGALAVAYAQNGKIDADALKFAAAASAISVTRAGAQSSIPTRDEVNEFCKSH